MDNGSGFVIGSMCGAALWLPPGVKVDSNPLADFMNAYLDPVVLDDFAGLIEKPCTWRRVEPHRHLTLIAVDPVKRRRSYGADLMSHALERSDRDKRPAYLESANAANLSLYQRFGFELLAEVQIGQSPARYPMHRQPQ